MCKQNLGMHFQGPVSIVLYYVMFKYGLYEQSTVTKYALKEKMVRVHKLPFRHTAFEHVVATDTHICYLIAICCSNE